MKRLLLFGALLSQLAFGFNAIINCGSTNLDVNYSTSSPSLQAHLTGLFLSDKPTLSISNPTSARICANTVSVSTVAPTAGNGNEHCMPPNSIMAWDLVNIPRGPANVFLRSDGTGGAASCSSGIIDVDVW